MLDHFLRARYHWDRHESAIAFRHLNDLLAGDGMKRVFYWTRSEAEHQAGLLFEIAVMNIVLTEGVLSLPFADAFARLWKSLPLQYLVLILSQRPLDRERDKTIIHLLWQAAAEGLLSTSADDYDLSGKVVIDPYEYPEIIEFLGGDAFLRRIERADADEAWGHSIASNEALLLDLFFYSVFHREPSARGQMILVRLDRIADSHDAFLRAFSAHLNLRRSDPASHAPIVSVGLRIEQAPSPSKCLEEFADALASRRFEPFVRRYFPYDE